MLRPYPDENKQGVQLEQLKVAIVHYWFVSQGGGEKVVETLAEMFPQADIFTLIVDPEKVPASVRNRTIKTSFLQEIPLAKRFHRHFLLLQPIALEQFDLNGYDLVISSESGPAKGVITSSKTCHVCYCHSPMRYLWDMHAEYRSNMNPVVRFIYSIASTWLRVWDLSSSYRVDFFVANSRFVENRIRKIYRRDSRVIHPPVETSAGVAQNELGDFYLSAGRLVDYKRVDLAVKACTQLGRPLRVVGTGPQLEALQAMAGPTVSFLGNVSDEQLRENYARCKALLHPGEEDFGITPVEAQSFGRPVIAFGSGGALETVVGAWPGEQVQEFHTGLFFENQTVEDMERGILRFEECENLFSVNGIAAHARRFDRERFKSEMRVFLSDCYAEFKRMLASEGRS
jgi:glycosyltransferase involved in cell wall biosynthesis